MQCLSPLYQNKWDYSIYLWQRINFDISSMINQQSRQLLSKQDFKTRSLRVGEKICVEFWRSLAVSQTI